MQIVSCRESVSRVRTEVSEFLQCNFGVSSNCIEAGDVLLAVSEGVSNAILHAHHEDGRVMIVELGVDEEELFTCCIFDTGSQWDIPINRGKISSGSEILRSSGRGLELISMLMDFVEYRPKASHEGSNQLILKKKIRG